MSANERKTYDLVVVGAGMMGSAAARHASLIPATSVCLVGPEEPKEREGREIFGCWYDEGRVYRRVAELHTWSVLATESVARYSQLEAETGIKFHTEVGYLHATPDTQEFDDLMTVSRRHDLEAEDITTSWKTRFPYLNFGDDCRVFWEKNAGHLSPRDLVRAQQTAASQHGADIIRDVVIEIIPSDADTHNVGGSSALRPLFRHVAPGRLPNLQLRTQTVAFLNVAEEEAQRLRDLPTFFTNKSFEDMDGGYVLPPIKYPEGNWYLKMGHNRRHEDDLNANEVMEWYIHRRGNSECIQKLGRFMQHLMPDVKSQGLSGDGCLTSHTPNQEPYIDVIAEGFGVALGGNRWAAKSSDEIGRLAARLVVLGEWRSEIPKERVRVSWKARSHL
ncbi:monomeric sarcosine oxidase-like [Penaeus monodon]|uniref:monomeric sarcosine oxidase-like n=1 Tax=Penaeus monodon TaxID=6687 RepID=UPI0018A77DF5|nr:monomeric sarcosine oxidase-like [Penaeus monodon]